MERTKSRTKPSKTITNNNNSKSNTKIRKPLSDCLNTLESLNPSQNSSTSTKNSTSIAKPALKSRNDTTSENLDVVLLNSVSTPSKTPKPSSNKSSSRENAEPTGSVYVRRQSASKWKGKEKVIAEPMSCFPAIETRFTRRNEMNEGGIPSLSKSCMLPNKKKRPRTTYDKDDEELIEKQRAYFAEIDAFNLEEEEVNSIDELD